MTDDKEGPATLDLTAVELDDLLGLFIGILSEKAWQYMGIRLAPGKSEVDKNMVKAKAAIDCVAFLTEKIAPSLSPDEDRRLRSMVTDLQLNYVKQV
ncbi:MAG: DUF1844 domain-containing protein [Candidatus Bathyarchaeota archaeon]|jgi:hypothetical protein|nr:DUF1844 domain-containing protein [Candidatus Bathyarchaeota archaeon]